MHDGTKTSFILDQEKRNFASIKFIDASPNAKTAIPADFVLFVSTGSSYGELSNWFEDSAEYYGKKNIFFRTSEHGLMYEKARVLGGAKHA